MKKENAYRKPPKSMTGSSKTLGSEHGCSPAKRERGRNRGLRPMQA
ncbi:MAG: hypothetical protein LBF51_01085 [Zoogloeaceae bacterium]|nr:hypothetical protein [Zoogloeaceae bacterium]